MRHESSSPHSSDKTPNGIDIIGTNPQPEGLCVYTPETRCLANYYKTASQAAGVCKRLLKTTTWNLGESFDGFVIWQDSWRVEDGEEKTWLILFR